MRARISSNVSEFEPHAVSVQGPIIGVITMDKITDALATGPDVWPPHSRRLYIGSENCVQDYIAAPAVSWWGRKRMAGSMATCKQTGCRRRS